MFKNCNFDEDSKSLHNNPSLLDLFLKKKAKKRLARWRTIATADCSKTNLLKNAEATGRPRTK
eukprot:6275547-Ditylum_brightwellii.AAC.1